ncbi:MAG: NAD(P)(+) transhydrogenase (Re/Si-specific) subunit beta, partial [Patescibacteria group bacterium]|nr:NAD(P)(+) transhydrogenase (Re/Si-specific) subunit beta [Patescibacteria group bacterium]
MDRTTIIALAYLAAAVLFILGLKGLTHPRSAVRGNLLGALAMLLAVLATLVHQDVISYPFIIVGLVIGGVIGGLLAIKIEMTAMPEMVALFNGFGGAASVFVAGAELTQPRASEIMANAGMGNPVVNASLIAALLAGLIGAVTFWGSL